MTAKLLKPILFILFFLCVLIVFKRNIGEACIVPSGSMENTIRPGDVIWVDKLFGQDPGSFLFRRLIKRFSKDSTGTSASSFQILRYEIVVFGHPSYADGHLAIKRVVGLPSDTIFISNNSVFINGNEQVDRKNFILDFRTNNGADSTYYFIQRHQLIAEKLFERNGITHVYLSVSEAEKATSLGLKLVSEQPIDGVHPALTDSLNMATAHAPLLIPSAGMEIELNEENYKRYGNILKIYENRHLLRSAKNIFLENGKDIKKITFKHNYYFLIGDNRPNSLDSRSIGLVCETSLCGKTNLVLFNSKNLKSNLRKIS